MCFVPGALNENVAYFSSKISKSWYDQLFEAAKSAVVCGTCKRSACPQPSAWNEHATWRRHFGVVFVQKFTCRFLVPIFDELEIA